jgi:hypothetical protein
MNACKHCGKSISVGKAKTCQSCYHIHACKYSSEELRVAICSSHTWQEVCILLGMKVYGSRYTYLRGRAKFFGISTDHLDVPVVKSGARKYTKDYLNPLVKLAHSWFELCGLVKIQPGVNNANKLRRTVSALEIECSHFNDKPLYRRKAIQEYLCYGSTLSSAVLRERLIKEGYKKRCCEDCGITSWRGFPPPLELDHIDSDPLNNTYDNLRIRCSNCHTVKTIQLRKDASLERKAWKLAESLDLQEIESDLIYG